MLHFVKKMVVVTAMMLVMGQGAGRSLAAFQPNSAINTSEFFWAEMKRIAEFDELNQREQVIARLYQEHFDFTQFYQRALIDHWKAWTPLQRKNFADLFQPKFIHNTAQKFSKIMGKLDRNMKHVAERQPWGYKVRSTAETGRGPITVTTYLKKISDRWMIIDLDIEGALLSRNYRGQFNNILRRFGYAELLNRIQLKKT